MFGNKIVKTIFINGMSCVHCSKRVEDALKSVDGVKSVCVSLDEKKATVVLKNDVDIDILKSAVEDVGVEVDLEKNDLITNKKCWSNFSLPQHFYCRFY